MHDLNEIQPLMAQWGTVEPVLSNGLRAIGEATNSCFEAQRKLVEAQKHTVAVVWQSLILVKLKIYTFTLILATPRICPIYRGW